MVIFLVKGTDFSVQVQGLMYNRKTIRRQVSKHRLQHSLTEIKLKPLIPLSGGNRRYVTKSKETHI